MKKREFKQNELIDEAYEVYINSDFNFTENEDGTFNAYIGQESRSNKMDSNLTLKDVEDFLLQFIELEEK